MFLKLVYNSLALKKDRWFKEDLGVCACRCVCVCKKSSNEMPFEDLDLLCIEIEIKLAVKHLIRLDCFIKRPFKCYFLFL